MEEAGIEMDEVKDMDAEAEPEEAPSKTIEDLNIDQLQQLLQMAIDEEDYEKAAELRDLINSKS